MHEKLTIRFYQDQSALIYDADNRLPLPNHSVDFKDWASTLQLDQKLMINNESYKVDFIGTFRRTEDKTFKNYTIVQVLKTKVA